MTDLLAAWLGAHPYRASIQAADSAFDRELAWLAGKIPVSEGTWQKVTALLIARALQLQRAAIDLALFGYDEEMAPIARAMLSTVITLTAVGHGTTMQRDSKALHYLTFGRKQRRARLRYNVRSHWTKASDAKALDAAESAEEDALITRAAAAGIKQVVLGTDKRFWSGLNDRELFIRMGVGRWYEHFYAPWSDESHASPRALVHVAESLERDRFDIGPQHRSPWFTLLGVSEFGFQVLVQVNKLYRHRRRAELATLWQETQRSFSDVAKAGEPVAR